MLASVLQQLLYLVLFIVCLLGAIYSPFEKSWSIGGAIVAYFVLGIVGTFLIDHYFDKDKE